MSKKQKVLEILDQSWVIGRINFSLGNLHIRPSGFHRIRAAIERNLILKGI